MSARNKKLPGARISRENNWVAPTGGWRADVPLVEMPKDAAAVLDNFFPEGVHVRVRNGSQSYATGMPAVVNTIIPYSGINPKLFAASGTGIYDISITGAVGAAVVSGLTNSHFSSAQITTAGGKFLTCVNGFDAPRQFNGTTWSSPAFTGPASINALSVITLYRSRLYFIEIGTTRIWYGGVDSITGALTSLEVGDIMRYGGTLVAMGVWTVQVASGVLQFFVVASSEGEFAVYQGSNPSDPTNWSLLGTFKLGYPLGGDRCMIQVGADLALMTADGIVPMSKAIALDPGALDSVALTGKISPVWLESVQSIGTANPDWSITIFARRRMVVVNVPFNNGTIQYVMNSETGAWCRFNSLPANSWAGWQNNLYFGSNGVVFIAETGSNDNGNPIDALMVGAYDRYTDGLAPKYTKLMGVDLQTSSNASIYAGISVDYNTTIPQQYTTTGGGTTDALWGTAIWGVDVWPGTVDSPVGSRKFFSAGAIGVALAPTVRAIVSGGVVSPSNCAVLGGSILYEPGQPV